MKLPGNVCAWHCQSVKCQAVMWSDVCRQLVGIALFKGNFLGIIFGANLELAL